MANPSTAFWCELVTVAADSTARSLYTLLSARFVTRSRTETIDPQCNTYQITASTLNGGLVYVGDSTLNVGVTPMGGIGAELAAGTGFTVPYQGGGAASNNLSTVWVASITGTNYILVRCYQKS